jgi:hypothetical protein
MAFEQRAELCTIDDLVRSVLDEHQRSEFMWAQHAYLRSAKEGRLFKPIDAAAQSCTGLTASITSST